MQIIAGPSEGLFIAHNISTLTAIGEIWRLRPSPLRAFSPPGLAKSQPARFLDLRSAADINASIKNELNTGCFDDSGLWKGATADKTPSVGFCAGQVMYHSITKDKGSSDPISGPPPRQRMYVVNCLMASTFAMQLSSRSKIHGSVAVLPLRLAQDEQ
jgi:hypothetical protein